MPGCDFTRRDMLRWTAYAAAAAPLAMAATPTAAGAAENRGRAGTVTPVNLELVTLAEDHAVITWYTGYAGTDDGLGRMAPAPADGEVRYGTHPARLNRVAYGLSGHTPYHHVELTGLEPGRSYYYQATSDGKPAAPSMFTLIAGNAVGTSTHGLGTGGPYSFTTPQPPRGSHLFSIVLCNDLHMGETQAGLVGGQPRYIGISQVPGLPPYPEVMLESLVQDVRRFDPRYLLAAGDISAEAVPTDLSRAGQLLSRFGTYREDYFVTRGNHDRAHSGAAYDTCRVGQWQGNDCFHDAYFPGNEFTYFSRDLSGLHVIGLDTYDKPGGGGDAGGLSPAQLDWFRDDLARHRDQPTLVFGHHPLVVRDSAFPITASNSLDATQASTILGWYAKTPGVFLHHAGHTHRNHLTVSPDAPSVRLQEVAAAKEYPGGFTVLRLHTGGYAMNFYKPRGELAREWSERSRQEILGFWPQFAFGNTVADRNTVVAHDLSGLRGPTRGHHARARAGPEKTVCRSLFVRVAIPSEHHPHERLELTTNASRHLSAGCQIRGIRVYRILRIDSGRAFGTVGSGGPFTGTLGTRVVMAGFRFLFRDVLGAPARALADSERAGRRRVGRRYAFPFLVGHCAARPRFTSVARVEGLPSAFAGRLVLLVGHRVDVGGPAVLSLALETAHVRLGGA